MKNAKLSCSIWECLPCCGLLLLPGLALAEPAGGPPAPAEGLYAFNVNSIAGDPISLATYRGQVLLIVNVASRCGFTKQYGGLQALYEQYRERGFTILGFPANDFMGQEPGSNEDIATFCQANFGVTFPLFEKISVKGKHQAPLYAWLTDETIHPAHGGAISWNFNKFLVNRSGEVVGRFGSRVKPDAPELLRAVEAALDE
ncbi:MAG: glutathione peroxidase [Candidatus Marinimicrobia bacterium]|nr:glutathione peroxidase [Candidatus Neomarinimicrobiota bacterium]